MCGYIRSDIYIRSDRCVDILGLPGVWCVDILGLPGIYYFCQMCRYIRSDRCVDIIGLPGVWIYQV